MYNAIILSEVAESEGYTLYDFISNKLTVFKNSGEELEHRITIPAEWIYYLSLCKITAAEGKVHFILSEDADADNTYHIMYKQGDNMPVTMNLISLTQVQSQAKWLLEASS